MNENIDLTKILKDCPKRTKLYSLVHGEVEFRKVDISCTYSILVKLKNGIIESFTSNGKLFDNCDGECILFPSCEQHDWSKFTAPWYKKEKMNTIAQIKKQKDKDKDKLIQELGKYKVKYTQEVLEKYINSMRNKNNERLRKTTIAFLKDFAEQGYENAVECIDWLEKQREQEEHKFKVGDKLIQNKFDPKTLKPFDKVLVRNNNNGKWKCAIFSHIKDYDSGRQYDCCYMIYRYCIPYNDDTKHLVGTTTEEPEYYKYWEE